MHTSLINVNLVAQDAIGQCLLNQTRFFRRQGDEVRIYTMHPPQDVPEDVAALTRVVSLADLIAGRCEHFANSDLYVYHYPGRYPLVESIKGLDRGAVIFYYHNVTPPELWKGDFERETLQHSRDSAGALAHYADLIVTDSIFNAEQLVEEHACERDRIHVLPLAVSLSDFSPGSQDLSLLRQYDLEGRQVILFVGRMAGNKRIDLLVEALPMVQREVPNAMLMLVGDNQGNPAIQETVAHSRTLAAELGVDDEVVFTGIVDELPPYYRLADVYATASLHEGFGVPLIEAMASGVPVVASRTAAHPWVVDEAGLLVEPKDAADLSDKIVRVLTDDGLCGELVRRGLARAREFSLEHYEAEWARIVTEATAWLPDQPYPRLRSLPAQRIAAGTDAEEGGEPPIVQEVLFKGKLAQLEASSDVMIRSYGVYSKLPLIGPLVAWLRRNLTSHLRGPYIDPMFQRQVEFNQQTVRLMRRLMKYMSGHIEKSEASVQEISNKQQEQETQLKRIDAWLSLISAQMSLLNAERSTNLDPHSLTDLNLKIEELRQRLKREDEL